MKICTLSRITAILLALAVVPACGNKKEEEAKKAAEAKQKAEKPKTAKPPKTPKKKTKMANLSPDTPRTKMGEIPVAADLEMEAERTVAIENLEAELDRLETEIMSVTE